MDSSPTPGATHLQVRVGLSGPALCASRAAFQGANLNGARLTVAKLSGANLEGAVITRADLISASLREANLNNADLRAAVLFRANLRGANLEGVYLELTNLEQAKADTATIWPEGFDPNAAGCSSETTPSPTPSASR